MTLARRILPTPRTSPLVLSAALAAWLLVGPLPATWAKTPLSPVTVFEDLDGTWEGTFVGWDTSGRELYRIAVRQTYRTVDAHTQVVEIEDRMPDGTVIAGRGENTARRNGAGKLELRCVVVKSNGERVEHQGRLVQGPDGTEELVWFSREEGREEMFRERVRAVEGEGGGEEVYEIDGVGRYGDGAGQVIVMAGRYRRAPEPPTPPEPEDEP